MTQSAASLPVAFVSHGAPTLAIDAGKGADLRRFGASLPRPSAVLVVSAHWERTPVATGCEATLPLLHDYAGFPPALAEVDYPAPGAPALAARAGELAGPLERLPQRPWDHGVWVPLVHLLPAADVPVLQLSLPVSRAPGRATPEAGRAAAAQVAALGRRLAPLRREGVLILGSGGLVHALGTLDWSDASPPPSWAAEFEAWAWERLEAGDLDALIDAERRSPGLRRAHPTLEHWLPLLLAAGAAAEGPSAPTLGVRGFEYGSLSRASIRFG